MQTNNIKDDAIFSVVGVCGINGNLIARILADHSYTVRANDLADEDTCRFKNSLKDYPQIKVYHGEVPESFFEDTDYFILPKALIDNNSQLYQKVLKHNLEILTVEDILRLFEPTHPVICITGTNGKTTTTNLLKHIVKLSGFNPCEHNLDGMQGNAGDIPALQSRLNGDVNILETGTFGYKGSLTKLAKDCHPDVGIITNITPDHLNEDSSFLDYARVKGELIELLENKMLIVNGDDPVIMGLIDKLGYNGEVISFGVDYNTGNVSDKTCVCGRSTRIHESISGVGRYECACGIKYSKPDYLACNINQTHDTFTLRTPTDEFYQFHLGITGIHNIYNSIPTIIVANKVLGISFEDIQTNITTFTGVSGRMEKITSINGKDVMVDYAHNPAGIETVLKELKHAYSKVINVITTSSESGLQGDEEILNCACKYADIVIPASKNSYECSKLTIQNGNFTDKIVLPDSMPEGHKDGTLGATLNQVLAGFNKAITLDADLIVCTGEAAFKYKDDLVRCKISSKK